MSFDFHLSAKKKFDQQVENAKNYLLAFIEQEFPINSSIRVMEIGCGEGGVLTPFIEKGAWCLGVDLSESRIENAKQLLADAVTNDKVEFVCQNVYDADFLAKWQGQFDLLILKDAIEHIPEQEKFIPYLKSFLKPDGYMFFGFPPWCMPFGGHQQIAVGKITSKLPWYHLLPTFLYKGVLKMAGESEGTVQELMNVKETRISTWRFEKIIRASGMKVAQLTPFLINPIYRYKFGWQPRKQSKLVYAIPGIRDFLTTAVYYLVKK